MGEPDIELLHLAVSRGEEERIDKQMLEEGRRLLKVMTENGDRLATATPRAHCRQTPRWRRSKSIQRFLDEHYYQDDGSTTSCSTRSVDHHRHKRDGSTSARSKRSSDHKSRKS